MLPFCPEFFWFSCLLSKGREIKFFTTLIMPFVWYEWETGSLVWCTETSHTNYHKDLPYDSEMELCLTLHTTCEAFYVIYICTGAVRFFWDINMAISYIITIHIMFCRYQLVLANLINSMLVIHKLHFLMFN
jgi:hypothetical protein